MRRGRAEVACYASCPLESASAPKLRSARQRGSKIGRIPRARRRRNGQLTDLLASDGSIESGAFLVDLNGEICGAKPDRCGHGNRKKQISDLVQNMVSHGILLHFNPYEFGSAST